VKKKSDCVMLAAGESSRMGESKLLLPFGGKTLIECSVDGALGACGRVILVTGHEAKELEKLFSGRSAVELVHNPEYRKGMFTSIQVGVEQVQSERFFIALGDMPLVGKGLYRELLRYRDVPAVIPKYRGKKGHPVLLSKRVKDIIAKLGTDKTLRDALAKVETLAVPVKNRYILLDIDEQQDYKTFTDGKAEQQWLR
jgi:molybdenum cofactor cytidylyltransferase